MKNMTQEEKYIIRQFQSNFAGRNERIAIYGIGVNTKLILETFPDVSVVGLMDAACLEPVLYGKRLLSDEDIVGNVDIILVVARKAVQGIIYPRISNYKKSGIRIVNIEGQELGAEEYQGIDILQWHVGCDDIEKEIDCHECISFDLFDTLLMRSFLRSSDVFEASDEMAAYGSSFKKNEFIKARCSAEAEGEALLDIKQIYEKVCDRCSITRDQADRQLQLEFAVEKEHMVARKDVCWLLSYARSQNKKVYILSDMYYGRKALKCLCEQAGVSVSESEIISSCEINMSKENGEAFKYLKHTAGTESILHIGDNVRNDYQNAIKSRIDAVQILSSSEMLLHSSIAGMMSDISSYAKRCCLGLILSDIFNSPFALNQTKGMVSISDCRQFGYFLGPVFYNFSCWLIQQACADGIEQMILPGRDGWLISQIMHIMQPEFEHVYIAASRRAYELASVHSEDDIQRIVNKNYKGTLQEMYAARFNVRISEGESLEDTAVRILTEAEYQRKYLMKYLKYMGIQKDCVKGIFDCVASGTVHACLEQLSGYRIKGYYFGTSLPSWQGLVIKNAFGSTGGYSDSVPVLDHYLLIENLLSERCGTFIGFLDGEMLFEDNVQPDDLGLIQEGILSYVRDAVRSFGINMIDLNFCNEIIDAVFQKMDISERIKKVFIYDDSYLGEKGAYRIWPSL